VARTTGTVLRQQQEPERRFIDGVAQQEHRAGLRLGDGAGRPLGGLRFQMFSDEHVRPDRPVTSRSTERATFPPMDGRRAVNPCNVASKLATGVGKPLAVGGATDRPG
jgi:hypothetical protein